MLHFGSKPPFSFERFLELCQDKIADADLGVLKSVKETHAYAGSQPTLKKYHAFEVALRNELVKIRASRKHIDPMKYIRGDAAYSEPYITHIALNAYRNPALLEAEKTLDQERWRALDELAVGHYFDLDLLLTYALKLLILERWQRINSAEKTSLLNEILN